MSLPEYFISCDWGTSNFRLRVVESQSLKVLAEHQTTQGIKVLFEKFSDQKKLNQRQFFSNYLVEQIRLLPLEYHTRLVVSSGMASSNIGLQDLKYADLPIDLSGGSLVWENLTLPNGAKLLLISGVKSRTGMMRGEEVQAIGLEGDLRPFRKGILLLPGTHSKHLTYEQGQFTEMKTFMTGELFELLSKKSILAKSVTGNLWAKSREKAFKDGLELGNNGQLSPSLFSIRARHLLQNTEKEDNYYFLSGLLIGDELAYLKKGKNKIFLAAPEPVYSLYQIALELILEPSQLSCFDEEVLEKALLAGQKKILLRYDK